MFIQLHALTSYPGTLLNRDDAGFAKTLPFGGTTRTRVSSQCLKYHWREFEGPEAISEVAPMSVRSRHVFRLEVAKPLIEEGYPAPLVYIGAMSLRTLLLHETQYLDSNNNYLNKSSTKSFAEAGLEGNEDMLKTEQIIVLGRPEVRYVKDQIREHIDGLQKESEQSLINDDGIPSELIDKAHEHWREYFKSSTEIGKNIQALRAASGLDAAMFGRMVTSDVLARGDAAVHVAHAFTTHAAESESDYFIAADKLMQGTGEQGAATIQSQELTSGLFYTYVVIDVPLLVSNLEGVERYEWENADRSLASEVVRRFVHLMATVSPGAKLGSTAPYSYAQCLLAESGTAQPRTLANAFQTAVSANGQGVLNNSYDALGRYVDSMDEMYGVMTERRLAAMNPPDRLIEALKVDGTISVPDVAEWTADKINGGA